MENSGFRMKGYSYPGQSPLKQSEGDMPHIKLKEIKITSKRTHPTGKFGKKLTNKLAKASKYVTKTFNKSMRDNEFLRGLTTKAALSMFDKKKKKKFTPVNVAGKQKKIM